MTGKPDLTIREASWRPLVYFLVGVVVIWSIFWIAMVTFTNDWDVRSKFGDMFGAVNALFSAFAFAGLIYTIILQRRDLAAQLVELRRTREELSGQREQLSAQNETFRRQSFETRFFEWLKLHHEIVNAIDLRRAGLVTRSGRDCFETFLGRVEETYFQLLATEAGPRGQLLQGENYGAQKVRLHAETSLDLGVTVAEAYSSAYKGMQSDVGHYFRNLYNLVKFVHGAQGLSLKDRRFYTNIIRAQLSSFELAMLFYNCLSPLGNEKFRPLVEQYGLLKNMDQEMLFHESHRGLYAETAFLGAPLRYSDEHP